MPFAEVVVMIAGILVTVAAVVLGAWLDLRPDRRDEGRLDGKTRRGG